MLLLYFTHVGILPVCICELLACLIHAETRRESWILPRTGVTEDCEPPRECWESCRSSKKGAGSASNHWAISPWLSPRFILVCVSEMFTTYQTIDHGQVQPWKVNPSSLLRHPQDLQIHHTQVRTHPLPFCPWITISVKEVVSHPVIPPETIKLALPPICPSIPLYCFQILTSILMFS